MKMYKGKESVIVHASQTQTMINRGWSTFATAPKPKKVSIKSTTKEAV